MKSEHPTTSWQAMQDGNVFYRRQQVYSIEGKLPELDNFVIAACRYAGPLALMRDPSKMVALNRAGPSFGKSEIRVYSSAGEGLLLFSWIQAKIIKFGWTFDERLVVLNEEGVYRVYDLQGDYQQWSLGSEATETGVVDARIHENGMVVMTGALALLEVKGWAGGKPLVLSSPGLSEPPQSWTIIPPDLTISRHVEVLISAETTIFSVDNLECVDQRLSRGPFTHIAPSPNGKSLALMMLSGVLWVVSADFQRNLAEYDTRSAVVVSTDGPVRQVEWCGNDAVLVTWDRLVMLVGPFGDTLSFFYTGPVHAVSEVDGVRVVGSDVCDFIQKVPPSTVSIFRPGSTSPAAILYDAWENFSRRSPKADENIRSIRPDLASAVDMCIDAAGREWEPYWQRRLLNAAKFGRSFLDLYNPADFVNMGQTLKVLNAVRFYEIGIPITYAQYSYTSPSHLVARLTSRSLHLLALRISKHLYLKPDTVLRHWACAKIAKAKPIAAAGEADAAAGDDELCHIITEKFKAVGGSGVSYADIAKRAWEVGRAGLATKLLDFETQAAEQVPLLLSMKQDRLALTKAVNSADTDLVYHVLLHLYNRMPLGSFFKMVEEGGRGLEPASKLLQVYAREQNREMLRDFYYSDDRRVESAVLCLEEAATMLDPTAKINAVKAAHKFFSEDKERSFEARMMEESTRLLTFQQQLEKDVDGKIAFFGKSVNETIHSCLVNGMSKKADKIRTDFKIPDKRFWYIKLHGLTDARDWEGLDAFAKSKRSPIGYEPFVRHLVEKGHPKEAATFVAKCDPPKRADLFADCDEWRMAGKECKDRGDRAKLQQIRQRCPNSLIARELDQILAGMK